MAKLQDLPNELLIDIFTGLPDIRSVMQLSYTCRTLWNVWIANDNLIGRPALRKSFDHFDNAYDLALMTVTNAIDPPEHAQTHLKRIVTEMERNDQMCKQVMRMREEDLRDRNTLYRGRPEEWPETSFRQQIRMYAQERHEESPDGYYIIRQLVLAHQQSQSRVKVLANVEKQSTYLEQHLMLLKWMMDLWNNEELRRWHGLTAKRLHLDPSDLREPMGLVMQPQGWQFAKTTLQVRNDEHREQVIRRAMELRDIIEMSMAGRSRLS